MKNYKVKFKTRYGAFLYGCTRFLFSDMIISEFQICITEFSRNICGMFRGVVFTYGRGYNFSIGRAEI